MVFKKGRASLERALWGVAGELSLKGVRGMSERCGVWLVSFH